MVNPVLQETLRLLTPLLSGRDDIVPSQANPSQKLYLAASASDVAALVAFYRELERMIATDGASKISTRRVAGKRIATQARPRRTGLDGPPSS